MLQHLRLLSILGVAAAVILFLTAVPVQYSYRPGDEIPLLGQGKDFAPDKVVEEFLWEAEYLPEFGTPLDCCTPNLHWDVAQDGLSIPANKIVELQVTKVTLASLSSLPADLLDDDPTYGALVDVIVKTANGNSIMLAVKMWDYGLLTPWNIIRYGDGWKPSEIYWQLEG